MKTDLTDAATWLRSLPPPRRARFLALLSHGLTVGTRVLCHGGGSAQENLESVRLMNEAQHRVAGYLLHFHAGDEDPRWITSVVDYVLGSKDAAVVQQAQQAWKLARQGLDASA